MEKLKLKASADDLDLSLLVDEPYETPKGIVQLVHGMCEHKERYIPFMEFLVANGYIVIIHDHRGHGESVKSKDDLGYMYSGGWTALIEDVKVVNEYAHKRWPGLPLTLFGHSMGSAVVRSYAKRYDDTIDKLFVCGSPSDNPATNIAIILNRTIGLFRGDHYRPQLMNKLSFGTFNKPFAADGYPSAWVCSDKEILKAYHSDPLCMYIFTVNGYDNLLHLMKDCYSRNGWKMSKPSLPVHFISGAQDPCRISDKAIANAADLMRKVGYANVDLKLYEGMRHEILNETRKQEVWDNILLQLA